MQVLEEYSFSGDKFSHCTCSDARGTVCKNDKNEISVEFM